MKKFQVVPQRKCRRRELNLGKATSAIEVAIKAKVEAKPHNASRRELETATQEYQLRYEDRTILLEMLEKTIKERTDEIANNLFY